MNSLSAKELIEMRECKQLEEQGDYIYVIPEGLYLTAKRYGFKEHTDEMWGKYLTSDDHPRARFYKQQPLIR